MRNRLIVSVAVIAALLAWEIGYGVSLEEALLYLGYELCFVVVPGWLAYLALAERPGGALRQAAFGWALGYVLEILAFMLTAATGTRPLFAVYPLIVGALAGLVILRRRTFSLAGGIGPEGARYFGLAVGAVCLGAVGYIALAVFPGSPLPGTGSVDYFIDYPRWISLAADAKHHWPIMDPSVSGEPLPYHYFINVHLAAAGQVTGLGLPLIYFRLFILPLTIVTVLLFVVAGQSLVRSPTAGLIAAALAFFVGELRLDPTNTFLAHTPFFGLFFTLLFRSPSFLLGLVIFIPLITLVGERITGESGPGRLGEWLLVAVFMVGASDAKISILPLLIAALVVFAAYRWIASRRVPAPVWISAGMATAIALFVYAVQYRGHSSGLRLDLFGVFNQMPAVLVIKGDLAGNLADFPGRDTALNVGGVLFGSVGLLIAPLVGVLWLLESRRFRVGGRRAWLFCLLGMGLVLGFGFNEPGTQSALYFLFYGIVAGYVLSADGLVEMWRRRPSLSRAMTGRLLFLGLGLGLLVVFLVGSPIWLDLFSGSRATAFTYMFRYGGLLLGLALLYVAARVWIAPGRWAAAALVSAGVLAVGALATPIDNLEPAISNPSAVAQNLGKKMTPGLYDALSWVREETPIDAVIAVNNQWIDPANKAPLAFIYSAFAERRVFLEGWAYSQRSRDLGYANVALGLNPFANRLRLNLAAFTRADLRALGTMVRDYGVRYLLIDELNGYPADLRGLRRVGEVVYRAPGVTVLRLDAGGP
jgi:hypothetical protein